MGRRRRRTIIPSTKRAVVPRAYRSLWRVVDGAVADCINKHPEYLTDRGRRAMQSSITKRVTGSVLGFACEAASFDAKRRSASNEAAAKQEGGAVDTSASDRVQGSSLLAWVRGRTKRLRALLTFRKGQRT